MSALTISFNRLLPSTVNVMPPDAVYVPAGIHRPAAGVHRIEDVLPERGQRHRAIPLRAALLLVAQQRVKLGLRFGLGEIRAVPGLGPVRDCSLPSASR
jgi:hypothetical protein